MFQKKTGKERIQERRLKRAAATTDSVDPMTSDREG
jgi:hypothetical protein